RQRRVGQPGGAPRLLDFRRQRLQRLRRRRQRHPDARRTRGQDACPDPSFRPETDGLQPQCRGNGHRKFNSRKAASITKRARADHGLAPSSATCSEHRLKYRLPSSVPGRRPGSASLPVNPDLLLSQFDYELPPELIAQVPAPQRSGSRLLHLDVSGALHERRFAELPTLLRAGDLLVFNDTRVIKARLRGQKESGGRVEVLVERITAPQTALA